MNSGDGGLAGLVVICRKEIDLGKKQNYWKRERMNTEKIFWRDLKKEKSYE